MNTVSIRKVTLSDVDEVLFANEVFYRAFAVRDPKVMEALWSDVVPVCCLHPGWGPIFDRQGIVTSWAAILTNPDSPEIQCRDGVLSIRLQVFSNHSCQPFPTQRMLP